MTDRTHSIALLRGIVEDDPARYFAALGGIPVHAAPLLAAGLIHPDQDRWCTADGKVFYKHHGLDGLPDGRANYWTSSTAPGVQDILRAASEELTRHDCE